MVAERAGLRGEGIVGDTAVLGGVGENGGDWGRPGGGMVGDLTKLKESRRNKLEPRSVWRSGKVGPCENRPILAVLARRACAAAGTSV